MHGAAPPLRRVPARLAVSLVCALHSVMVIRFKIARFFPTCTQSLCPNGEGSRTPASGCIQLMAVSRHLAEDTPETSFALIEPGRGRNHKVHSHRDPLPRHLDVQPLRCT